jgi:DNA helicase II / ATP-dependent DNA helicase PcrA
MEQELSKEQKEIAFFKDCEEALLVKASAGSGKTRILTERVRYLLTEKKDKFFSVLCLTFTNKAADEMKERLKGIPKLSERTFIGNFHDFCQSQIIRKQRHEIGLETMPQIFDENDRRKILEDVFLQNEVFDEDYKNLEPKQQQQRLNDYLAVISDAKQNLVITPEIDKPDWNFKRTLLYNDYNDRMHNQNAMDYDDILLYAFRILTERPVVSNIYRRLYRYILVDEAQDLNFAQYQILRAICGETHKNVLLVGDPKQAIYAFNGASVDFMLKEFVADFNPEVKAVPHNFRSSAKVLELAHHIRSNGEMSNNNYFEGVREMPLFDSEKLEAAWIISKIKEWQQIGYYEEKDMKISIGLENIAVLARNRYVLKELMEQLDADETLKNQYFLRKGSERFEPESQLIKAFDLGLRILVNPLDVLHFNQLYQELGLSKTTNKNRLESLLTLNQLENLTNEQKTIFNILVEVWVKLKANPKLIDNALNTINQAVINSNFAYEEKLKIDYDIKEFKKLWVGFLRNTPSENQSLANFRYFLALNGIDDNKKGLTLATVHTVKGLEYDIVFLMGMNEGVLPDYRAKNDKALAEERNNAYVAVTRAKKCIYVTYPKSRIMPWGAIKPQAISRFIEHFV